MEKLLLSEYKKISLKIIELLNMDHDANEMLDKRMEILENMFMECNDKYVIRNSYKELGLDKIDEEIRNIISNEMTKTLEEIKNVGKRRNAQKGYLYANRVDNIFSEKI